MNLTKKQLKKLRGLSKEHKQEITEMMTSVMLIREAALDPECQIDRKQVVSDFEKMSNATLDRAKELGVYDIFRQVWSI